MRWIVCSDDVDRLVREHFSADRMCVNGRRKRRFVPARTVHLWYQWGFCASVVIETGVPTLSSDSNHPQIPASTPRGPVPKGEILVRTHGERRPPAFHRSSSFDVCTPTGEPWEPARCCWYIDVVTILKNVPVMPHRALYSTITRATYASCSIWLLSNGWFWSGLWWLVVSSDQIGTFNEMEEDKADRCFVQLQIMYRSICAQNN